MDRLSEQEEIRELVDGLIHNDNSLLPSRLRLELPLSVGARTL